MANTSSRMLRLLSLLQTHRYWPGSELAERLEVSVRTLRRDIDRLRELGYPVEAHRGVDGGYQLAPGAALPPLVVDDEEAVALAVGLQAAAQGAIAGIEDSSVRALTKIEQVMPPRLRRRVETLRAMTVGGWGMSSAWGSAGPTVDPGILTTVAQACRDTERLEFTYTAASGEQTARHVEPHRLVALGRHWYLVAYDLTRHDWRSFRLDRLDKPRNTGARFRPRTLPADDAAAFVRAGIDNLTAPWTVAVRVHAPGAAVRDRIGRWGTVEDIDDQRCLLRMTADSLDWPAMALGAVGADFEVLYPPELLDHVRDWGNRFSRATGPDIRDARACTGARFGAVEAGGTKVVCLVGSDPNHIVAQTRIPTGQPAETLAAVLAFFQQEVTSGGPLSAIGIASFGPLELRRSHPRYGVITASPKPGWSGVDLVGPVRSALGVPVGFDTDVNAAALAEGRWGAARGLDTFVYLTVGTGIGAGAVVEGRIIHGLGHPEMGHLSVPRQPGDDFPGNCPFHGDCLEGMASGPAIAARWGLPAEQLHGDRLRAAVALEAAYLAAGLRTIVYAIAPQRIVIGGGVSGLPGLFPLVSANLVETLAGYPGLPEHAADDFIVPAALGSLAGPAGALVLADRATSPNL